MRAETKAGTLGWVAALLFGLAAAAPGAATPLSPSAKPAAPALSQASRPIVIGQSYTLPSAVLGAGQRINVWLPPGYSDATRRFPVLYLLDGAEDEDFHHITGLAQVLELNGRYGEMIVVGIVDPDRRHDLTAPSSDPRDLHDAPTSGGSAAFRRYLASELTPAVDARFRTNGHRVLIGESLAGLFTVETFLRAPTMFDGYIAISPSLWWDNQSLAKVAPQLLAAQPPGPRTLFLSIGDEGGGMQAGLDLVIAAIRAHPPAGLTLIYEPLPKEQHPTVYHPAALSALRQLFPLPPASGPAKP